MKHWYLKNDGTRIKFGAIINTKNFHLNLLKIAKKSHKDIDIYYIGHITIKKFSGFENLYSINLFYLIIHSATGYFKEKNG